MGLKSNNGILFHGVSFLGLAQVVTSTITRIRRLHFNAVHKIRLWLEGVSLSAVDIVRLYKELSEVERGFRNLKDVIDMRPIYHQTDERVQAHIFVAALAFLLHRALEKKLKAAGIELSATEALGALKTIRVVDIDLGNGETKRCVTPGSERATRILAALGITDRNPPAPPKQDQTLM